MHITVIGAGAVGCYYGGMMARAGHHVTLVGRAQHVEAINKNGLLLETLSFTEQLGTAASTVIDATSVGTAELILFCVKSDDTEASAQQIAPFLAEGATVLSLQNGVDNAARLEACLYATNPSLVSANIGVAPAVVYVAAGMAGPGHVKHHGRGELVIGPLTGPLTGQNKQSENLAEQMRAAGIPVQISSEVMGALWTKLVINCAYNALSAISQRPYGELFGAAGIAEVMRDLVDECLLVAAAAQVDVPDNIWQAVEDIAQSMSSQFSSTAQDLARGKRTEIEHLNGFIVRQGAMYGIATPLNHAMTSLVKLLEKQAITSAIAAATD